MSVDNMDKNRVRTLTTTRLGEVSKVRAPSTFLEIGYHDNPEDAQWIISNIPTIARSIAKSLTDYFDIPFVEPNLTRKGLVSLSSGTLNLRQRPSISSQVLRSIPNGTVLNITDEYNGWYRTNYDGANGYVSATYIDIVD